MVGEEAVRRRRRAGRDELIERLNSEEQSLSREEPEERERRAEESVPSEKREWLHLAVWSLIPIVFGLALGIGSADWIPHLVGLLTGALLVRAAYRRLGWGRPIMRFVSAASFAGLLMLSCPLFLIEGRPTLPLPATSAGIAYGTAQAFLLGAGSIAGVTATRLSYEDRHTQKLRF